MKTSTLLATFLFPVLLLPAGGARALPAADTDEARQALAEAMRSPAAMAPPTSPVRRLVRAEALVMAHTRLRALPVFLAALQLAPRGECGPPARLLRAAVRVRPMEAAALAEAAMEADPECAQVLQVALLLPLRPATRQGNARPDQVMVASNTTFKDGPANVDAKVVVATTERPTSETGPVDDLAGLNLGEPEAEDTGLLATPGMNPGFGSPASGLLALPPIGPAVTIVVNQ